MASSRWKILLYVAAALVGALFLWVQCGTKHANRLVDEGNAAVDAGNALVEDAAPLFAVVFDEKLLNAFPEGGAAVEAQAREVADVLEKAAAQYRLAAGKFEEASKQPVSSYVSDYWELKLKAMRKLAESKDQYRQVALLLLDRTIASNEEFLGKANPLLVRGNALNGEYDDLAAKADKIQSDHPDDLK